MNVEDIRRATIEGERAHVERLVEEALRERIQPLDILESSLIPAMDEVGERFEKLDLWLPEMMKAAEAMRAGLGLLRPLLAGSRAQRGGLVALGTVKGDIHDIGKNLVGMMLEGAGFEVVDLGIDVPAEVFVARVRDGEIDVLGMSAMLTTTQGQMRTVLEQLRKEGLTDRAKVIVGGAPLTHKFAMEIGADGFAPDAVTAVAKVRELMANP